MTESTFEESALLKSHGYKERIWIVLACHMAGEITDNEAANILGKFDLNVREHALDAIRVAEELLKRYRETGKTVRDDLQDELAIRQQLSDRIARD